MKVDKTIATYLSVLGVALILVAFSSRHVIFRPWTGRTYVAAAAANGQTYVFGGLNRSGDSTTQIFHVDPVHKTLKRAGRLPVPMHSMGAAELDGKIYLVGGMSGKRCLGSVLVYDPANARVDEVGSLPEPRAYGALAVVNGTLYYLGGFDGSHIRDEVLSIDPETGQVATVAHLPEALNFHAAVALNDRIYVLGGENTEFVNTAGVIALNPKTSAVRRLPDLPFPMVRFAAAAHDGAIVLAGGPKSRGSSDLLLLEPESGKTTSLGRLDRLMPDSALVDLGDFLYVIGGAEPRFGRQLYVLRIDDPNYNVSFEWLKSFVWW